MLDLLLHFLSFFFFFLNEIAGSHVSFPVLFILNFYLFIYFCLPWAFATAHGSSAAAERGATLQCRQPLLWNTGSRRAGFGSCGTQTQ